MRDARDFVLHPLTSPHLLNRALAEIIGNVKPPTATAEEISKAALEVIRGSQIADRVAAGQVIASSADRCAICLDDYEADHDCRVLKCSALRLAARNLASLC